MLLDLSEIFVCPRCRPAQGLVVLVDELRDRRLVRGRLGCPHCEVRYPVDRGTLRFDAAREPGDAGAADDRPSAEDPGPPGGAGGDAAPDVELFGDAGPREAALRLGALLGLPEAEGPFLLLPGLAGLAVPLAELAEDEEVVALAAGGSGAGAAPSAGSPDGPGGAATGRDGNADADADTDDAARRVTRLAGASARDLPVFSGRVGAAALLEGPPEALEEAVRTVREGGRIVVVAPGPSIRGVADELPLEVAADEARALVAVRRA